MDEVLESWAEGLYRTNGVDASEASSRPPNTPRAYPRPRTADRPAAGDDAPTGVSKAAAAAMTQRVAGPTCGLHWIRSGTGGSSLVVGHGLVSAHRGPSSLVRPRLPYGPTKFGTI
jgi:hypothetical protein